MLVEERRQRVLDLVSHRGFISLADLAETVQVSESTLRRDLDYWHQQGVLKRTGKDLILTIRYLLRRSAFQV